MEYQVFIVPLHHTTKQSNMEKLSQRFYEQIKSRIEGEIEGYMPEEYQLDIRYGARGTRGRGTSTLDIDVELPEGYVADFVYERNGKTIVEDCKGAKGIITETAKIKKKLLLWVHGIELRYVFSATQWDK